MKFEQLNAHLEGTLEEAGITELNELQRLCYGRVKQGGDCILLGDPGSGKSTAAAIVSVMKAPKAFEGSPRVLIWCSSIEKADKLHQLINRLIRKTEIAAELVHDKGNMIQERNNLFEGADIIVGTSKRILDLYIQNGFHVGQLSLLILDDADEICSDPLAHGRIARVAESLPKCQWLFLAAKLTAKLEKLSDTIQTAPLTIETSPAG